MSSRASALTAATQPECAESDRRRTADSMYHFAILAIWNVRCLRGLCCLILLVGATGCSDETDKRASDAAVADGGIDGPIDAKADTLAADAADAAAIDAVEDAFAADATAASSNDFADGFQGWKAVDLPESDLANATYAKVLATLNDLQWQPTGGQSGGYLSRRDTTSFAFFFDAPAPYLGNLAAYAGGTLEFYLRSTHATWTADNVVVLVTADDVVLVHPIAAPGTNWTSYKVPLVAAGFKYKNNLGAPVSEPDFAAALANVKALRIPGEWGADVEEVVGFDSVVLKK